MQLQMTAPLDIGLEQTDASLGVGGQDDVFDLTRTEVGARRNRNATTLVMDDNGDAIMESSDEEAGDDEDDEDEVLDSEEEREKKVSGLEAELDGLYETYQGRLRERDAKFKVKEARRKNAEREEWGGIKAEGSGEENDSDDDAEEGGWDKVQAAKLDDGGSDSMDSSDESDDEQTAKVTAKGRKRDRTESVADTKRAKRQRLVSQPDLPQAKPATNAASRMWFSQDVFNGIEDLDKLSDSASSDLDLEEGKDEDESSDEDQVEPSDEDTDDDFEVVPQDQDDTDLWDAEDDDEDMKAKANLQSGYLHSFFSQDNSHRHKPSPIQNTA